MLFKITPPDFIGATLSANGRRGEVPTPIAGQNNSFLRGDGTWSDGLPLDVKDSVRVATTANITLSGAQTIDGVAAVAGNRVLVKNQTAGQDNGIYVVAAGAWARSTDADTSAEVSSGMYCWVTEGTTQADNGYILTTADPIVLGTTSLSFTQFSGAGMIVAGANITKSGNTLSVTPAMTGLTSLTLTNGGAITDGGTGALTLAASGTNQNVTITPSGTGALVNSVGKTTSPAAVSYSFTASPASNSAQLTLNTNGNVAVTGGQATANITIDPGSGGTMRFGSVTAGNSLFGTGTDSSNGRIQNPGTTYATGYGVGTTVSIYAASADNVAIDTSGTASGLLFKNSGSVTRGAIGWSNSGAVTLYSNGLTAALAFDASQDALFTPTSRVRISSTKVLSFGATANATIGVSADTTAGLLTYIAPSSGGHAFTGPASFGVGAAAASGYAAEFRGPSPGNLPARFTVGNVNGGAIDIYDGNNSAIRMTLGFGVNGGGSAGINQAVITSPTLPLWITTNGALAITVDLSQNTTFAGVIIESTDTLSGAGAISVTRTTTKFTSTGAAQALTLANGTDGQIKRIIHDVDGGSGVLTPTTKTGYTTITFTNAGDSVSLQYVTTRGWIVISSFGVTIA